MDSSIAVALIGAGATVAAAVLTTIYARREHPPTANGQVPPITSSAGSPNLDNILTRLERHRQRATFGVVAGLLGREPLTLFDGYPRTPLTSWVVSKSTGKPTGHDSSAMHPDLFENPHVISNSNELRAWLTSHT